MFLQLKFFEVASRYDAFGAGLFGAAYFTILFFLVAYAIIRGYVDNPAEVTIQILLPVLLISFFLNWADLSATIIGTIVLLVLLYSIKHYMKLTMKVFLLLSFQILTILWVFGNAGMFAQPLMYLYIVGNFIRGELLKRDREKNNKKEEEPDKK